MPALAILGSARSDGNTALALRRLIEGSDCDVVDLNDAAIAPFNYEQVYPAGDEFLGLVERIVEAPLTILSTPVCWYSYSTPMKTFVDRFTDLLKSQKPSASIWASSRWAPSTLARPSQSWKARRWRRCALRWRPRETRERLPAGGLSTGSASTRRRGISSPGPVFAVVDTLRPNFHGRR